MNEEKIQYHKNKLGEEKGVLEGELKRLGVEDLRGDWRASMSKADHQDNADPNVKADMFEDFAEKMAILEELETRHVNIEHALEKISKNDGSYGICEINGNQIEEDRLGANPAARTCKSHL